MVGLTLRTARAHLTRSLLSSLAVVLGVAFVAGSLMFTDGLAQAMTGRAAEQYRAVDVEVTSGETAASSETDDMLDRVRAVDGVRAADTAWTLYSVGLAAADGRKVGGDHRVVGVPADPALRSLTAGPGRLPSASGEVALDERTADRENLRIGDQLLISNSGQEARRYTVVGLTAAGADAGALLALTTADVEAIAGWPSTTIIVDAAPGVTDEELAARIAAAVGAQALPHDELVRQARDAAVGDAETFRNGLIGFGVIAVCMAAFVIANTFTILLAQRTRETALLRLIGATRRQVFRSVLVEAAVIGLGGSVLGLGGGFLLAYGLPSALSALGVPAGVAPVLTVRTAMVALAVGAGVTVVSALLPARRGTAVPPVAALSDAAVQVARATGRARRIGGTAIFAAGLAGLFAATAVHQIAVVIGGTLLTVTGFLLLSPIVVPALVRIVARPLGALGGATVSLALLNAVRNPRRIATTTNALVVGVTLVGTFTLIARSAEAPAERRADEKMFAQFLISDSAGLGALSPALIDALRRQPEIGAVHPDYQAFDNDTGLEIHTGAPRPGTAVVTADADVAAGGTIKINGRTFEVASIAPGTRTAWLTPEDITAMFETPWLADVQADPAAGVSTGNARTAIDRALAAFPAAVAYDRDEYAERLNASLNEALGVVTALLALAVLIALVGVANTLTLSVVERTRENALLRAIGLTRRQLRLTLATEALVMALTGTLIGVAVSVAITLSALGSVEMHGSGLALTMPWDRLGVLLAVAALVSLTASILPARRAVRLPTAENLAADG
ncbi:FtsX-like permease family protein [Paractinoplanes hotanensis]|uniref:FtsX-like permease family protein n=1 Tax=Paractinoplanes hotanensis TaxID=2906497 RepID=A0ABT0Y8P6_9ACTN|nr:FtsX-like permease family protein [Actinoplanes hotanensis]MCM4082418.1 FtsX-like permease family protein [Actinoplanes hotanensis]